MDIETIPAKTIVTRTKSRGWFGVDYNMNIYRGCSHGCIYCDSRSDCYQIFDFDRVRVKENALQIIRDDLCRKVKPGVIATGSMSDPYNILESKLLLTRNALELISAYGFGAAIATKSDLVARDIDVLREISQTSPVIVKMSVTAGDDELARKIEPNVSVTSERFLAISKLAQAGIYCGVLLGPVLPFITDSEDNILRVLRMSKEAGAKFVHTFMGMTLRSGNREYYYNRLKENFDGIAQKHEYKYGRQYINSPPNSRKLWKVFADECMRLGLIYDMAAITNSYKSGYKVGGQLSFFDIRNSPGI